MLRKCLIVLLLVLLLACSQVPPPTSVPPEKIGLKPIATPSASARSTSTNILSTVSPSSTADPNFFRDDFTGTLNSEWTWVREDPRFWSLEVVPGFLQISVRNGYVVAGSNSNLLMRTAPEGDFQIETQVIFRPIKNFQLAGLIVYDSNLNFIQAGRGYCQASTCVGEGLYMDYYEKGVAVQPNYGQPYDGLDPILLRLKRKGTTYIFEGSTDGKVWFTIGSRTSDMKPLQIGLVAGQNVTGSSRPALFDYFQVRSVP